MMPALREAALDPEERRALERFVEELDQSLEGRLDAVWLYGSRARGDRHEESDVDLIVLTEGGYRDRKLVHDVMYRTALEEGAAPESFIPHIHPPDWPAERRAIRDFFIQEVDRDKIVLYGEP